MRAIICLSGLIMIRLKLDSETKTERQTERDEVLVEVNISRRGYNDPYELGVGLWDVESEKWRKRRKLEERKARDWKGEMKTEVTRGQKWKNLSAKCSSSPERERV